MKASIGSRKGRTHLEELRADGNRIKMNNTEIA
jgi:hypothetical protein